MTNIIHRPASPMATRFTSHALPTLLLAAALCAPPALAQTAPQTFDTPQKAADALVQALQSNDILSAVQPILGPDGKDVLISGDPLEDKNDRDAFIAAYRIKHQIVASPDGTSILVIGPDNWPTPIPLRKSPNGWFFDTAAGKQIILYRRIGRNELDAISVVKALAQAERDYANSPQTGRPKGTYAAHFWSSPERHNGLYWEVQPGEPESPAGPLLAYASAQGYEPSTWPHDEKQPYCGYYYKILTAQGPHAPGGTRNYFSNGALTGGFAILAYPAEYKTSGVMTFIVSRQGPIYEKDLGDSTPTTAPAITAFDPDSTWTPVTSTTAPTSTSATAKKPPTP